MKSSKKQPRRFFKGWLTGRTAVMVLAAASMVFSAVWLNSKSGSDSLTARAQSVNGKEKKYRATRRTVKDPQTGEVRLPTEDEITITVASLEELTRQPEGGEEIPAANGGVGMDLQGGFGGTMLFRANPDGSSEMKCVFSLEEGLEFLGLVPEVE